MTSDRFRRPRPDAQQLGGLLAVLLIFLLFCSQSPLIIYEDAFITFRYAEHLSQGLGLAFNHNGVLSEGYSNPLWLMMLAGAAGLGLDLLLVSRYLGLTAGVGLLALLWHGSRGIDGPLRALPAMLIALSPVLVHNVGIGLETPFFALLGLASVWLFVRQVERSRTRWREQALLTGLLLALGLTRPEGWWLPVVLACSLGLRDLFLRERTPGRYRWLALWGPSYGLYLAWKLLYFGQLLPNTYHCKVAHGFPSLTQRLTVGLSYALAFFVSQPTMAALLVVLVLWVAWRPRWRSATTLAAIASYLAFIVAVGGDELGFAYFRFFLCLIPLVCLLLAWCLADLQGSDLRLPPTRAVFLTGVLLLGSQVYLDEFRFESPKRFRLPVLVQRLCDGITEPKALVGHATYWFRDFRHNEYNAIEHRAGHFLGCVYPPGTLMAGEQAGQIPYFSGLEFLDLYGLVTTEITHVRHLDSEVLAVVERHQPDLIVTSDPLRLDGMPAFLVAQGYGLRWIVQDVDELPSGGWRGDRMYIFQHAHVPSEDLVTVQLGDQGFMIEADDVLFTGSERFADLAACRGR